MRKRVQIALAGLLVALVSGIAWLVLQGPHGREPVYQGKRLSVWLSQYVDATGDEAKDSAREAAESAVQKIGTNAIPTLLRMLGQKDSVVVWPLIGWWNRHLYSLPVWLPHGLRFPSWYRNQAWFAHIQAAEGFVILGAEAQQAVPALIKLYQQNTSADSQVDASIALNAIGPEAQRMAIPSYLRAAASSSASAREVGFGSLAGVDVEPQQVVPILAKALSDTNVFICMVAIRGLVNFGTNAQQAAPALVRLLGGTNASESRVAMRALRAIDPEAAAKASVK